ncbi:MAG: hypothetical protein FJX65_18820 [Alphaproteobacteria bacterium]|nr:hypothetical protein [Alphaproteobacteria bacterium]
MYFDQKADLNFAFRRPFANKYYFFDLATSEDETVKLQVAAPQDVENPDYWPEAGFFSRSHTNPFKQTLISASIRSFKIDGKWAANEFSHFHGKMSDLYALFGVLGRLDGSHGATERGFIRQATVRLHH